MTTWPSARTVRAAIFAAVCVTTTALGHALMSGSLPWWVLAAAFVATGAAAYHPAGRERGALFITGSTVVTQLVLHTLFEVAQGRLAPALISAEQQWAARLLCDASATSPALRSQAAAVRLLRDAGLAPALTRVPPPTGAMSDMGGMSGGRMGMAHAADAVSGGMGHLQMAHTGQGGWGMFLAHLLAALVCGLWLWRGETAAFQLARSLTGLLFAPLLLVLTTRRWGGLRLYERPVAAVRVVPLRGALLRYDVSRRGPPQVSLCC